ncbi:hypothetical protein HK098_001056 [Nowakowskiella sp. JEL0407]|nr:hypothetical protein HK098_001056 [Nowakowskiella sp. JEL0407]
MPFRIALRNRYRITAALTNQQVQTIIISRYICKHPTSVEFSPHTDNSTTNNSSQQTFGSREDLKIVFYLIHLSHRKDLEDVDSDHHSHDKVSVRPDMWRFLCRLKYDAFLNRANDENALIKKLDSNFRIMKLPSRLFSAQKRHYQTSLSFETLFADEISKEGEEKSQSASEMMSEHLLHSVIDIIKRSHSFDHIWDILCRYTTLLQYPVLQSETNRFFEPSIDQNSFVIDILIFEVALEKFASSQYLNSIRINETAMQMDQNSQSGYGLDSDRKTHCERFLMLFRTVDKFGRGDLHFTIQVAAMRAMTYLSEWSQLESFSRRLIFENNLDGHQIQLPSDSNGDVSAVDYLMVVPFGVLSMVKMNHVEDARKLLNRVVKQVNMAKVKHTDGVLNGTSNTISNQHSPRLTSFSFGVLIETYIKENKLDQAVLIYELMLDCNVAPDNRVVGSLLSSLQRPTETIESQNQQKVNEQARGKFQDLTQRYKLEFREDVQLYLGLVCGSAISGRVRDARDMLDKMKLLVEKNGWNVEDKELLIQGYTMLMHSISTSTSDVVELESLLDEMKELNLDPSITAYGILMHCHYRLKRPFHVLQTFHQIEQVGLKPDQQILNIVLATYVHSNNLVNARAVFDKMMEEKRVPGLKTISTLMSGYVREQNWDEVLRIYNLMISPPFSYTPDLYVYHIMMDRSAQQKDLSEALEWYKILLNAGHKPTAVTYSILMYLMTVALNIETPKQWYIRMSNQDPDFKKDAYTFSILMNNSDNDIENEDISEIGTMWGEMINLGIKPNTVTYTSLLKSYLLSARYQETLEAFSNMISQGVRPDAKMYHVVMRVLLDIDNPEAVVDLYQRMDFVNKVKFSHDVYYFGSEREKPLEPPPEPTNLLSFGEPDAMIFSTALSAALRMKNVPVALQVFWTMRSCGVIPDKIDYRIMINEFLNRSTTHDLKQALRLFCDMRETGVNEWFQDVIENMLLKLADMGWMSWCARIYKDAVINYKVVPSENVRHRIYSIFIAQAGNLPDGEFAKIYDTAMAWIIGVSLKEGLKQDGEYLSQYFDSLSIAGETERITRLWMLLVQKPDESISPNLNAQPQSISIHDSAFRIIEKDVELSDGQSLSLEMKGKIPGELLERIFVDSGMRGGLGNTEVVNRLWFSFVSGEMLGFGSDVNDIVEMQPVTEKCTWGYIQVLAWFERWVDVVEVATNGILTLGLVKSRADVGYDTERISVLQNTLMLLRRRGKKKEMTQIFDFWDIHNSSSISKLKEEFLSFFR